MILRDLNLEPPCQIKTQNPSLTGNARSGKALTRSRARRLRTAGRVHELPFRSGDQSGLAIARFFQTGSAAAQADRDLLAKLVDVRSAEADDSDGSATDAAYATAFRAAGLDLDVLSPNTAGARIRSRPQPVAVALAAALDDWSSFRHKARPNDSPATQRLVATARAADPDPRRDQLRALWYEPDIKVRREALRALATQADIDTWPATTLSWLAQNLESAGDVDAALLLLRRTVARHADDVWINYKLGRLLAGSHPRPEEAIRFYTAARALRPESAHELAHALSAHGEKDESIAVFQDLKRLRPEDGRHLFCLARALAARGRISEARAALDGAISAFRTAIQRVPDDAHAHSNLGVALRAQGQSGEAITEYRTAVRLRPEFAEARRNLAHDLQERGQLDEAAAEYRETTRLNPNFKAAHAELGDLAGRVGRWDEAVHALARAYQLDPNDAYVALQLASLYAWKGDNASYRRHCDTLLEHFGGTSDPVTADRTAKACLLSSRPFDERGRASRLAEVVVTAGANHQYLPWFRFVRGLAEYRAGRPLQSMDWLSACQSAGAQLAIPANLVFAMAEQRAGHADQARRLLANAAAALRSGGVGLFGRGESWHDWMACDLLRREAEATILYDPVFPANSFVR